MRRLTTQGQPEDFSNHELLSTYTSNKQDALFHLEHEEMKFQVHEESAGFGEGGGRLNRMRDQILFYFQNGP